MADSARREGGRAHALPTGAYFAVSTHGTSALRHNCEKRPLFWGGGSSRQFARFVNPLRLGCFRTHTVRPSGLVGRSPRDRLGRVALLRDRRMGSRHLGGFRNLTLVATVSTKRPPAPHQHNQPTPFIPSPVSEGGCVAGLSQFSCTPLFLCAMGGLCQQQARKGVK